MVIPILKLYYGKIRNRILHAVIDRNGRDGSPLKKKKTHNFYSKLSYTF